MATMALLLFSTEPAIPVDPETGGYTIVDLLEIGMVIQEVVGLLLG